MHNHRKSLSGNPSREKQVGNSNSVVRIRGAFHSTEDFGIFIMGTNGTEISWGSCQEIRKLLNF